MSFYISTSLHLHYRCCWVYGKTLLWLCLLAASITIASGFAVVRRWEGARIGWRQMSSLVQRGHFRTIIAIYILSECVYLCVTFVLLCHHINPALRTPTQTKPFNINHTNSCVATGTGTGGCLSPSDIAHRTQEIFDLLVLRNPSSSHGYG